LGRLAQETPLVVSYLNGKGIKVISYREGEITTNTHTDQLMTYIRYWQAQGESMKTAMRVADAGETSVRQGKWRGGRPPYGYRSVSRGTLNYKGKPIFDVEIDPEQAEVVKVIYRLYTEEHYGGQAICKYLNDRKIPTQSGGMWTHSYVHIILRNQLYTGVYVLGKKNKKRTRVESPVMPHMIIIDRATFDKARKICKKNDTRSDGHNGQRKTVHGKLLLTGLLYCGECGGKFTSHYKASQRIRKDGTRWERNSYRCNSYYTPVEREDGGCHQGLYKAEILDNLVISDAKAFIKQSDREKLLKLTEITTGERLRIIANKASRIGGELARAEKEHAKLENAVVKSLMGDGEYPPALLNKLIAGKVKEITDLTADKETLDAEKAELQARLTSQKAFAENLDTWETRFDQADGAQKKAMLQNILDRIIVGKNNLTVIYKLETRRFGTLQPIELPDWLTLPAIDGTPQNPPPTPPNGGGGGEIPVVKPQTAISHTQNGVKVSTSATAATCPHTARSRSRRKRTRRCSE
jgi:hypothetical protein